MNDEMEQPRDGRYSLIACPAENQEGFAMKGFRLPLCNEWLKARGSQKCLRLAAFHRIIDVEHNWLSESGDPFKVAIR